MSNKKRTKPAAELRANDYHKYVFADGEFVGEFDKMYRECADPWHIDGCFNQAVDRELLMAFIRHYKKNRGWRNPKILEIGCAKGRYSAQLSRLGRVVGIDIAPTAIKSARRKYKNPKFIVADIRKNNEVVQLRRRCGKFSLVVGFGFLWYVIDKIDAVLANINSLMLSDGVALLDLRFYAGEHYGSEIVSSPEDFIRLAKKHFHILERFDYFVGADQRKFTYLVVTKK